MTYLPETRQQLVAAAERRAARRGPSLPRLRLGWLVPALSLAVAAAVAIAFLGVRTQSGHPAASARSHQVQLVYQAQPTPEVPVVTREALKRSVQQMDRRLTAIPHSRASIRILSGHRIRIELATRAARSRVEALMGSNFRIEFYDWEGNVLLRDGKTAASQNRSAPPPLNLYQAVKLASRQPFAPPTSRAGSEYYLFARDGRRLLAGPLDPGPDTSRAQAVNELMAGLPRADDGGRVLVVKPGTVVLEAAPKLFRVAERFGDPDAGYYVLRDHVALFGNEITNPRAGTTQSGAPDVQFGFTGNGAIAFRQLTADLARRGELESTGSKSLEQHFAVALDNQLILVSPVDYTVYPDGISGSEIHLSGPFIRASAHGLAKALQLGALPVTLKLLHVS